MLIHNAARLDNDTAVETPSNRLREVFEVNLIAPNTLNYFTLPFMHRGSAVLYVGSTLSEKAVPHSFSYVVSKHAMVGMMRAMCQDLVGPRNPHRVHLPRLHRHRNVPHNTCRPKRASRSGRCRLTAA